MALTVFDTDVVIDGLRGRPAATRNLQRAMRGRSLALTPVQVHELVAGIRDPGHGSIVLDTIRAAAVVPLDAACARISGEIAARLRRSGRTVPTADLLIAGVCLRHDLALATRNLRHFGRIPGLRFAPPAEEE